MFAEFKYFMEYNNSWNRFVKNAGSDYMNDLKNHDKTFSEMIDVISDAFVFGDSEEGFDYWSQLHSDWIDYCKYWKEDL